MPQGITVYDQDFFRNYYSLSYISPWDNRFKQSSIYGKLRFYEEDPKYVVNISILADRDKLDKSDIHIYLGRHNYGAKIEEMIDEQQDEIYDLCKKLAVMDFIYDLKSRQIVEPEDFTEELPIYGIHTLFAFADVKYSKAYCLINATQNIKDEWLLNWLCCYVISYQSYIMPTDEITHFSKLFTQVIASLFSSGGDRKRISITLHPAVLTCELADSGNLKLPIPGKSNRLGILIEKAKEEMLKSAKKIEKRNSKNKGEK